MNRHIQEEIEALKSRVLYMGSLAEEMIHLAAQGFTDRNEEACKKVFEREEEVNKLQLEIDQKGVRIIALFQPEATDLRTIVSSIKINAELERVADQAVNISQTVSLHMMKEAPLKTLMEIPRMAEIAQGMIKKSLDAYAKRDVELAKAVLKDDEEEDLLKAKALNGIIEILQKNSDSAKQLVDLILIAKNLEKIGDHATNIAEDVIFMVLGEDIRHPDKTSASS